MVTLLSCKFSDSNIAQLQLARKEHSYVASCKIGWLLRCNLQDTNIVMLQVAGMEHC